MHKNRFHQKKYPFQYQFICVCCLGAFIGWMHGTMTCIIWDNDPIILWPWTDTTLWVLLGHTGTTEHAMHPCYKSHNSLDKYTTMHHLVTEMANTMLFFTFLSTIISLQLRNFVSRGFPRDTKFPNCRGKFVDNWAKNHKSLSHTHIRADSRFAPSQWETPLLYNEVSHWQGANLESALHIGAILSTDIIKTIQN